MNLNTDQWIMLWTIIGLIVLITPLTLILSKERFYDTDINRWRPGINLPSLAGMQGKKINFKKLQKDVRVFIISVITLMSLCMLPLVFIEEGSNNYTLAIIFVIASITLLSIALVWFTFAVFPKWGSKYIKKA